MADIADCGASAAPKPPTPDEQKKKDQRSMKSLEEPYKQSYICSASPSSARIVTDASDTNAARPTQHDDSNNNNDDDNFNIFLCICFPCICTYYIVWPIVSIIMGTISAIIIGPITALLIFGITVVWTPWHIGKMLYVTVTTNECFHRRQYLDPVLRWMVFMLVPIAHFFFLFLIPFDRNCWDFLLHRCLHWHHFRT
jgi:hypothetical protein